MGTVSIDIPQSLLNAEGCTYLYYTIKPPFPREEDGDETQAVLQTTGMT